MNRNGAPPTKLNIRDVCADRVWRAMLDHADEIAEARDVLRLAVLRDMPGERIAVAVADNVAIGRVVGATGTGRIRAVEEPER